MIGRMMVMTGLVVALAAPAFAGPQTPGVDKRERHQQQRIREGVKSGELTKREARKLEREQAKIRKEERAMKSDGVVTKEERKELHQDLNEASKHIAKEKHDAQTR